MGSYEALLLSAYTKAPDTLLVTGDFLGYTDITIPVAKSEVLTVLRTLIESHKEDPGATRFLFRSTWSKLKQDVDAQTLLVFYLARQILFGNPIPYKIQSTITSPLTSSSTMTAALS